MKRSEALEEIKRYNNSIDPYDDRPFEEQILWFMECALGMIPPNQYANSNEFRFEWEKE